MSKGKGKGRTGAQDVVPLGRGTPPGARQIALVPGALVPLLPLDLPPGLRGQAREEVARRQLADRAGLDGASAHIRPFHAPGEGAGWTRALVADAARVARWRQEAGAARAVLPDYLALPAAPGIWALGPGVGAAEDGQDAADGGTLCVRLGPGDGFSAPPDMAARLLAAALAAEPPRAVLSAGALPAALEADLAARDIPVLASPDEVARRGLPRPVVLGHGEAAFDLRRDPQAARARLAGRVLPWRWPALAGLLAAALWAGAQIVVTRDLAARTALVRAETTALVRAHFIPDGPILDIRTQVARALADRRQEAAGSGAAQRSPVDLLARAAAPIAEAGATPEEIAYDGRAATLVTVLLVADFAAVDRLAAALRAAGLAVEVAQSRVREADAGVRTELRLRAGDVP